MHTHVGSASTAPRIWPNSFQHAKRQQLSGVAYTTRRHQDMRSNRGCARAGYGAAWRAVIDARGLARETTTQRREDRLARTQEQVIPTPSKFLSDLSAMGISERSARRCPGAARKSQKCSWRRRETEGDLCGALESAERFVNWRTCWQRAPQEGSS